MSVSLMPSILLRKSQSYKVKYGSATIQLNSVQSFTPAQLCNPTDATRQTSLFHHQLSEFCSNSCPSSWWCHPTISSSVVLFSCLQSFPASGTFPMSQFFSSGSQSIGPSSTPTLLIFWISSWITFGDCHWVQLPKGVW